MDAIQRSFLIVGAGGGTERIDRNRDPPVANVPQINAGLAFIKKADVQFDRVNAGHGALKLMLIN